MSKSIVIRSALLCAVVLLAGCAAMHGMHGEGGGHGGSAAPGRAARAEGEGLSVSLEPTGAGRWSVRVADAAAGAPVEGARVSLGGGECVTSSQGLCLFEPGRAGHGGEVTATVRAPGKAALSLSAPAGGHVQPQSRWKKAGLGVLGGLGMAAMIALMVL